MPEIMLGGIEGQNPHGFMAAVGLLNLLTISQEEGLGEARLSWRRDGYWRPVFHTAQEIDKAGLVVAVLRAIANAGAPYRMGEEQLQANVRWNPERKDGKKNGYSNEEYKAIQERAVRGLHDPENSRVARARADFAAAIARPHPDEGPHRSNFALNDGASHQNFLGVMEGLHTLVREGNPKEISRLIEETLFEPWRYGDQKMSFRWGPQENRKSAYIGRLTEGARTMHGANLLGIYALPLLPSFVVGRGSTTTRLFRDHNHLRWPIWTPPLGAEVLQTVFGLPVLYQAEPPRQTLLNMGIREVFEAQRIGVTDKLFGLSQAEALLAD